MLKIEYVKTADLISYANNPRKNDAAVDKVAESIREFGFKNPIIVDGNNEIIAGHTRLKAAEKLGIDKVPTIKAEDLTPEQAKAFRIADNKTHEFAEWDMELLTMELAELDGMFTGFDDLEIEDLLSINQEVEEVEVPEPPEVPTTKRGDIWQLGRHRLMCGDSTSQADADSLMDGEAVDLFVTDPPYNMGYEGAGRTSKEQRLKNRIKNDNMSDHDFQDFIGRALVVTKKCLSEGGSFYIFYKELGSGVFLDAVNNAGLTFKQMLIWVKNQIVLGGAAYQNIYEPFIYGCNGKKPNVWNGKRKQRSVIESIDLMYDDELRDVIRDLTEEETTDIIRVSKRLANDLHPTMKPVRLLGRLIKNSSHAGGVVADFFGGSGSTLLACEQLSRNCYMMELDEKYCDVIIKRWEDYTGGKAELLNG